MLNRTGAPHQSNQVVRAHVLPIPDSDFDTGLCNGFAHTVKHHPRWNLVHQPLVTGPRPGVATGSIQTHAYFDLLGFRYIATAATPQLGINRISPKLDHIVLWDREGDECLVCILLTNRGGRHRYISVGPIERGNAACPDAILGVDEVDHHWAFDITQANPTCRTFGITLDNGLHVGDKYGW